MSNIYKYIVYILLSILCKINAKEVIIESKDINNIENVINIESQKEENLILKFNEKYYDMSNLPSKGINLFITSNITFSGYSEEIIFDFKNENNGIMNITYLENKWNNTNIVKFENIIFKNFGQECKEKKYMFIIDSDTDMNYLKFENCTFIDNKHTLFKLNVSNYDDTFLNSDYFITFDNCVFR